MMQLPIEKDLAWRVERADTQINLAYLEAQQELLPNSGASFFGIAGGVALYAGPTSPISRVVGLGFLPTSNEALEEILEFYQRKRLPTRIEVCSLSKELTEMLLARGFTLQYTKNVWLLDLKHAKRLSQTVPVRQIKAGEEELWSQTVGRGFASREEDVEGDVAIARPSAHSRKTVCFVAELDGQAAGGAMLAIEDQIALCSGTSTRVAFRRRGAHQSLLAARLSKAQETGASLALVHTSTTNAASQRNIERAGFQLVYQKATFVLP